MTIFGSDSVVQERELSNGVCDDRLQTGIAEGQFKTPTFNELEIYRGKQTKCNKIKTNMCISDFFSPRV